jgi:hypothetical protein
MPKDNIDDFDGGPIPSTRIVMPVANYKTAAALAALAARQELAI